MRKFLVIVPAVALPVILAASLAAGGGSSSPDEVGIDSPSRSTSADERGSDGAPRSRSGAEDQPSSPEGGAAPATTEPAPSVQAAPGPRPTGPPAPEEPQTTPQPDPGPQFTCPEGGMAEVVALQQAVDDGHQPWRLSAPDVAAACTFGVGSASVEVEPPGPNTYRVTSNNSGEALLVEVAQPLGPGTIWVVSRATPAE